MKYDNVIPSFYFVIPSFIGFDTELTLYDVFLYGIISSLCNTFGFCYATNSYLAQLRKVDERTVKRSIAHLQEKKYIYSEIDILGGNKRKIYLSYPSDKNVPTPSDKNVPSNAFNNKYNINNLYNKTDLPPALTEFYDKIFSSDTK